MVLDWLLESADPSVRYRTLTDLLGAPSTDPEVVATRAEIASSAAARRILEKMHPDGYWLQRKAGGKVVGDGVEYGSYATTHYCLGYLAELGLDRGHPVVHRAAERYLELQAADGDFWHHMPCLYGFNIRTFVMLGYGADPRLARTIALMSGAGRADGGYLCDMYEGRRVRRFVHSCARGSAKTLLAYASLPALWGTVPCEALVGYFLGRGGLYRNDDPGTPVVREAIRTTFPFTWRCGLIDVLLALSTMGHGDRPELDRAWAVLEERRDAEGRYRLEWSPTQALLDAGRRGTPSKWVTFYALLALARRHGDAQAWTAVTGIGSSAERSRPSP